MKKIFHEISGFFTILSFIIKDTNATVFPFVPKQLPEAATKPASKVPGFVADKNDAVAKDNPNN